MKRYLSVEVDGQDHYIQLDYVQEVTESVLFRILPNQKDKILGIAILRDKLIPIIDLNKSSPKNSLIILSYNNTQFGLAVEKILGIKTAQLENETGTDEYDGFKVINLTNMVVIIK